MRHVKSLLHEGSSKNGLYVYCNPPLRVRGVQLREWIRMGLESKLERAVLAGQGRRLLADDMLPLPRYLVNMISSCEAVHAAVEKGSLLELQDLLVSYNHNKYVSSYDAAGAGLIHKAVFYNYVDIVSWLVTHFPHLVHQRDTEGRTALHYTAASRDEATLAGLLTGAGAERGARDAAGHTLAHYRATRTLLLLPEADMPSSPKPNLVIKRHNIRIWCHECDMGRLQRVIWEGQGSRLLSEVSSQPIVKKFLEALPYIMNSIKDIHVAVIQNDLEGLIKLTNDPVPPQILSSIDSNNMTVFHKAAGLGHCGILKYIIDRFPQGINTLDNDGRTPLHYAAIVKDDQHTYKTLIEYGADEGILDSKKKTPAYYSNRTNEIDKTHLKVIPEAPRTPSNVYPSSWDWKILDTNYSADLNKKTRKKKFKSSSENISSINTSNTISETAENINNNAMKNSSTSELIDRLPELNDGNDQSSITEEESIEVVNENAQSTVINEKEVEDSQYNINGQILEKEEENNPVESDLEQGVDSILDTNNEISEPEDTQNENHDENGLTDIIKVKPIDEVLTDYTNIDFQENEDHKEFIESDTKVTTDKIENLENIGDIQEIKENNTNEIETETGEPIEYEIQAENDGDKYIDTNDNDNISIHSHKNENLDSPAKTQDDFKENESTSETEILDINSCGTDVQDNINDMNSRQEEASITLEREGHEGRNTHDSLIEGIVCSEAENDSQDASVSIKGNNINDELHNIVDTQIDPEVTELINTANMEMLATLVLNGEGSRLIGRHSENLELQAFIENVPTYMQKINRVHLAACEGNIKDLQAALDRRKFAIARDPISPNGSTPLHVATVFGRTSILKYLGGRFPETLSAVDFEGRTALHYAAVLPDNGHYYNLLQQLGANTKDLDDNGDSAEDYYKNPSLLPLNQLLNDFSISEETAKEMFSDKQTRVVNGHLDIPIFHTEEGRYLAKSLGDPLIKGLTEVANVKPKDPIAFLATFLHNFPEDEKPRIGTQESKTIITKEEAEYENDEAVPEANIKEMPVENSVRSAARTATRPKKPIDVITVEPNKETSPDAPEAATTSADRDEHGQSMLHFAAARTHTNNALFQLLQETDVSLGYRDELYRTARDISIQANVLENTAEIDRFVLHIAARGETARLSELLLQGYDHILDVVDEDNVPIAEVISQRGNVEMSNLLTSIPNFEESRERLHGAVRRGDLTFVKELVSRDGGRMLARAQNSIGRTSLHVAVLAEQDEMVAYLAEIFPELLRTGDNLERTPLHYAMGVDKMESLSRILTKAGAKRVLKDLKGRQPSYYYMNKSEILRLKEEEEVY